MPPKGATSLEISPQLMPTMPASVSLAVAIASSSVSKRNSGSTGPKVSSCAMRIALVASASTVGS